MNAGEADLYLLIWLCGADKSLGADDYYNSTTTGLLPTGLP